MALIQKVQKKTGDVEKPGVEKNVLGTETKIIVELTQEGGVILTSNY